MSRMEVVAGWLAGGVVVSSTQVEWMGVGLGKRGWRVTGVS